MGRHNSFFRELAPLGLINGPATACGRLPTPSVALNDICRRSSHDWFFFQKPKHVDAQTMSTRAVRLVVVQTSFGVGGIIRW